MKISYIKNWCSEGYCYNQRIKITTEEFNQFEKAIEKEVKECFPNWKDYCNGNTINTMFLLNRKIEGKNCFLKSTQRIFFSNLFNIKLKDRNTYLSIN